MGSQTDQIMWRNGDVPVSVRFDDPFFSLDNGVAETTHVFLGGNDLPARFAPGFHIAELGFGTGLNAAVAWDAWRQSGQQGVLHFTSFEAFPMAPADMARAQAAFPWLNGCCDALLAAWDGSGGVIDLPQLRLEVITGDARTTLGNWQGHADAWFLDGFAPAKNPELWEPSLMAQVAAHTATNGTCATYTAAGYVRRALAQAGFEITRVPGFGRKRHMSVGKLG